jgi:hypothetical protein
MEKHLDTHSLVPYPELCRKQVTKPRRTTEFSGPNPIFKQHMIKSKVGVCIVREVHRYEGKVAIYKANFGKVLENGSEKNICS